MEWTPTPQDVHNLIPTRGGGRPFTEDQARLVQDLIEEAVVDVIGEVGEFEPDQVINPEAVERGEWPITLGDLALRATALKAAVDFEDQFNPEQEAAGFTTSAGSPPAARLFARYRAAIERLKSHKASGQAKSRTIRTPSPLASLSVDAW